MLHGFSDYRRFLFCSIRVTGYVRTFYMDIEHKIKILSDSKFARAEVKLDLEINSYDQNTVEQNNSRFFRNLGEEEKMLNIHILKIS